MTRRVSAPAFPPATQRKRQRRRTMLRPDVVELELRRLTEIAHSGITDPDIGVGTLLVWAREYIVELKTKGFDKADNAETSVASLAVLWAFLKYLALAETCSPHIYRHLEQV